MESRAEIMDDDENNDYDRFPLTMAACHVVSGLVLVFAGPSPDG